MKPITLSVPVVAVIALSACASQSATTQQAATTASPTTSAAPSATAAAVKTIDGNITIAPADGMPPGPMKITPLSCGKLTAAQRSEFGTTAAAGLVYRFTNGSNTLVAAPKVSVNFTSGATVAGSNVTASLTQVSPGQSATGEVDALGDSGQNLKFTGCQVMSYALVTSSGVDPASFAS